MITPAMIPSRKSRFNQDVADRPIRRYTPPFRDPAGKPGTQPLLIQFLCRLDSASEPPETGTSGPDFPRGDRSMAANEPGFAPALPPFRPPPAPATPAVAGQYEFTYSENTVIGNLGSKMSFVGLFMLGIGLFFFVSGIVRWGQSHDLDVGLLFLSLLFIVVGIWTHRAGREFRSVAETEGKDISHLMGALANLLKLYTLLYMLFFVALVFAIIQLGAHSLYGTRPNEPGVSRPVQSQGSSESGLPVSTS